MAVDGGGPDRHRRQDPSLTNTEPPGGLLIRARQAHDDVTADPARFGPVATTLVAEARRARDPEALALALRALARAQRARLDDMSAIRLLDEACRIARRHHMPGTLADLLMSRSVVSQELGRLTAAWRDLRAAAPLVDGARSLDLDWHRAVLLQNTSRLPEAALIYHRLLADPTVNRRRKAECAHNLALIEAEQGRYGPALRRLSQTPGPEEIGPTLAATLTQTRAWVTVQSGRFAEGLRIFEAAADAHRAAGASLGDYYIDYADALTELRLLPEATQAARRSVEEFAGAGIPLVVAEAQLRVARLAVLSADWAGAMAAADAAAAAFRKQTRTGWRARAVVIAAEARLRSKPDTVTAADVRRLRSAAQLLEKLGTVPAAVQGFLVTGRLASALGRRRQAVTAFMRAACLARGAAVLVRLQGQISAALAARLRHHDREVLTHCRSGLADLARHRSSLPSVELRALASAHGAELGRIGLEIVVRDGSPARVLNWMERSRAAALVAVEPPAFGEISADIASLRAAQSGAGRSPGGSARAQGSQDEQALLEDRIRQATWRARLSAGTSGAPIAVGTLRDSLAGRVLVAYGSLGGDLLAVVVEPRRSRLITLGPLRPVKEQLRAFLFASRRLAEIRQPAEHAAARASADLRIRRFTELLIGPLRVNADAELVIVPLPGLDGVPWTAMHDSPVSLAPSATFWARTAMAAASQNMAGGTGQRVVLVAGPGLPGAAEEVAMVARSHASARCLIPPASTADTVASLLADADLAHLACHGIVRADNPMFSSLVLSDGPMTVQELYSRGLAPARLILASCESGVQSVRAADEVLGFVGALLARGTIGVLASAAVVPDVPAVGLMTAVHRRLSEGSSIARALYDARQLQDIDEPGAFVNWCTFSAHGAA